MTWSNGGLHILRANPSGILGGTNVNFYSSGTGNEKIYSEQINAIIQSLASNYIVFTGNKCEPSVSTTDLSSAGTHLAIATGTAFIDNTVVSVSAGSVDLSSAQSGLTASGESRYVLVTVNSSGSIVTATENVATGGNQTMPEVPEDEALICMVYLDYDTTTFVNNQIADMRIFAPHGQYIDGNSHLADDNKIYFGTSNDSYVSWDNSNLSLALRSNGGLIVTLDDDNNSTNEFRINNGGDTTVVKIDESGNAIFGAVVGSSNAVGTHTNYRQFQIGQATILANSGSASTGDDSWFITNAYYTSDGNFKLKEDGQATKISLGTTGALNHGVSASGSADDTITFSTVFEVNGSGNATFSGTIDSGAITSTSTITGQFVSNATIDFNHPIDLDSNSASDFSGSRTGVNDYILRISNTSTDTNDGGILRLRYPNDTDVGSDFGEVKYWIAFEDGTGVVQGSVTNEVTYTTFTGSHEGIVLEPNIPLENWRRGVIVSSTGDVPSNATFSRALVNVDISTSAKDKTIMGVFDKLLNNKHEEHELNNHVNTEDGWTYEDSEGNIIECPKNHVSLDFDKDIIQYNAVGEGMILVTNADGDIQNGDYITTGTYNGIGVLQDDDLQHSYTVAKCTEQVDWNSVVVDAELGIKVKLVACTYHCG